MNRISFVISCIIFLCLISGGVLAAEEEVPQVSPEELAYHSADIIKLSSIAALKPLFATASKHYTISEDVRVVDPFYVFDVKCEHGEYRIKSVRQLMKVCHEIDVIENFRATKHGPEVLNGAVQNIRDIGRGAGTIVFHPGQAGKAIVRLPARLGRTIGRLLMTPFNRMKNDGKETDIRTRGATGFLYSGEILKAARQLKLDAYSDNINVQALLRSIGKKRKVGSLAVSVAMPSLNMVRMASYAATPGALSDSAEVLIASNNAHELRRINAKLFLDELGLDLKEEPELKKFLYNYYFSPRERTYIRLYLTALKPVEGLRETIAHLAAVNNAQSATYYASQLNLLVALHYHDSPLHMLVPLEGQIAALNKRRELMMVIPYDIVRDNEHTRNVLAHAIKASKGLSAVRINMWFTGDVSWDFYGLAKRHGALVRQNVLKDPVFKVTK